MANTFVVRSDPVKRAATAQTPSKVARKPTNVSLPTDLLERARELNVNVSRASERGLREAVEAVEAAEARAWAMIGLPAGTRISIVAGVTDMRAGFQGLAAKVQTVLLENPLVVTYSSSAAVEVA